MNLSGGYSNGTLQVDGTLYGGNRSLNFESGGVLSGLGTFIQGGDITYSTVTIQNVLVQNSGAWVDRYPSLSVS